LKEENLWYTKFYRMILVPPEASLAVQAGWKYPSTSLQLCRQRRASPFRRGESILRQVYSERSRTAQGRPYC